MIQGRVQLRELLSSPFELITHVSPREKAKMSTKGLNTSSTVEQKRLGSRKNSGSMISSNSFRSNKSFSLQSEAKLQHSIIIRMSKTAKVANDDVKRMGARQEIGNLTKAVQELRGRVQILRKELGRRRSREVKRSRRIRNHLQSHFNKISQ